MLGEGYGLGIAYVKATDILGARVRGEGADVLHSLLSIHLSVPLFRPRLYTMHV